MDDLVLNDRECFLLTGATGLVGRYLLAGLLRRGLDVAVLVRGTGASTAEQRVNEALEPLESAALLPRPRVIAGELTESGLGATAEDRTWLQGRRLLVIHCAASIRFVADERSGEPYRTNVAGMRNFLEFCWEQSVDAFHYVSTAYVGCRSESGVAREVPVADTSVGGNDYERSKIQAEQLVQASDWIPQRVIHRPSIVVGDSQTGYTSTFHGFYAPLQIGAQFAKSFGFSAEAGDWFRTQLGVRENDSKNLVPVDWVAESIVQVATAECRESVIYHWTHPRPVPCHQMQRAIVDALESHFRPSQYEKSPAAALPTPEMFREQMQVYESYFGNDPVFERMNARSLSSSLPCPDVSYDSLRQMAEFAVQAQFGWPRPRPKAIPFPEVAGALRAFATSSTEESAAGAAKCFLSVKMTGPGSPERLCYVLPEQLATEFDGKSAGRLNRWYRVEHTSGNTMRLDIAFRHMAACIIGTTDLFVAIEQGFAAIGGSIPEGWQAILADWVIDVKSKLES